ncbi:MAG: 50S ribosomal protein L25 [Acidimicrobiales bacterium]
MAEFQLLAEPGRPVGTRPARRLRTEGHIPAVVYGRGVEAVPVTVKARDLRAALSTEAGLNAVLNLQVDGKSYLTMARELQHHPVRGNIVHVDFQVVDPNREINAEVPITLIGEAVELHRADGVLDQQLFSLPVFARPADIPPHLEVDISSLTIGSAVRVSDISLPEGVRTELDPESVVAAGQAPRVQVEEVEAAEGVEGEAAEGEAAGEPSEAGAAASGGGGAEAEGGSSGSEEG